MESLLPLVDENLRSVAWIRPELALTFGALVLFAIDLFWKRSPVRVALLTVGALGVLGVAAALLAAQPPDPQPLFNGMISRRRPRRRPQGMLREGRRLEQKECSDKNSIKEHSMTQKIWQPLSRDEVIRAIERRHPPRIPLVMAKWWGEGLEDQYGDRLKQFDCYPEDVVFVWLHEFIEYDKMGLSWDIPKSGAHDARAIVDDWSKLDSSSPNCPIPKKTRASSRSRSQQNKRARRPLSHVRLVALVL